MKEENTDIIVNESEGEDTVDAKGEEITVSVRKKINLPNKLTIFRLILVPIFMIFIYIPAAADTWADTWTRIFAASIFLVAALTDLLDGILARRLNMTTNFGRLMDPLADKFMVIGAFIAITASETFAGLRPIMVWVTAIIFFRELAVTSVRLIANESDGMVISANFLGKLKTFSQIVCIMTILLERIIITETLNTPHNLFSYITIAIMTALTIYSGFTYFKNYWGYIDPTI